MTAIVRTTATGSWPIAVSPDSITASVPSKTALATSLTSARVGDGAVIIDSSICVAVITGTPSFDAVTQDALLEVRDVLDRAVDAEVPASDHHRIGRGHDLVQMIDRRPGLDLRHELRAVADDGTDLVEVGGGANERDRDVLHAGRRNRFGEHEIFRRR